MSMRLFTFFENNYSNKRYLEKKEKSYTFVMRDKLSP
jgi:hypothetical protein